MTLLTYRQALHDTLREELLRDESVILLGEEIGVFAEPRGLGCSPQPSVTTTR